MPTLRILSAAEQVANHLRQQLAQGIWTEAMPGGAALARELGIGRMTADAALDLLEAGGQLVSQGAGRKRRIVSSPHFPSSMKIALLPYRSEDYGFDFVLELQRLLAEEGHTVLFPSYSITELGYSVPRVARMVQTTRADAWLVVAGPRDVLSWFAENGIPTFAMFGRRSGLPIPSIGPDKQTALRQFVRHAVELGHKRITMITRPLRRLPEPGLSERAYLDELNKCGIKTSSYHLLDWDGETNSLAKLLDSIYKFTPPTAVIADEPPVFFSVQQHLARRGILAPDHVSLACTDWDPYFELQRPSIAHVAWNSKPWVRRVIQWVRNISQGKIDQRQSLTKTEFVIGDSLGPARISRGDSGI